MATERIVEKLTTLAIAALYRGMQRAAITRYRKDVTDQMQNLLEDLDRARGVLPPVAHRTRAQLLVVKRPIDASADASAVVTYVRAIALGAAWPDLADRVQATGDPELMRRFLRYAPSTDRIEVRETCAVAEVMCS